MRRDRCLFLCLVLCVVAASLWVRAPLIKGASRYFYHEDDGHHFNHTVEMAQAIDRRGDFNPHYFNKPSLHFYLRIPVVFASVAWARHRGELTSIKDLRTRDPRVAEFDGYRWTPSHPTVLQWNRAFSIALSVLLVVLSCVCAGMLVRGQESDRSSRLFSVLYAGLVPAFSLEVLRNSHSIGVDVLMALMCLVTTVLALGVVRRWSPWRFALSCVTAGLACSSKYNAAPIAILPLVVWALHYQLTLRAAWDHRARVCLGLVVVGGLVLGGFLLGTPYAALSPVEFFKGVTYEVWHYGVAGHEGHSAQPGLAQALFYLNWLISDGVGLVVALCAAVGVVGLMRQRRSVACVGGAQGQSWHQVIVFLTFPCLYAILMVCQKANFTRNMVVIVPYVAVVAAYGIDWIITLAVSRLSVERMRVGATVGIWLAVLVVTMLPLGRDARAYVESVVHHRDSRDELIVWLVEKSQAGEQVAVSGRLHMPLAVLQLPGIDSFLAQRTTVEELRARGYAYVVVSGSDDVTGSDTAPGLNVERVISGEQAKQRIPDSPEIRVFRVGV